MSKASISDGANIVQMPADVVAGFLTGEHEPKSERLEIRFSKNQMAALAYVAERLGVTVSETVRRTIFSPERLSQMMTMREWRSVGDYAMYRRAVGALTDEVFRTHQGIARVGNNVNQIARKLNRGVRPAGGELKQFTSEFAELKEQLAAIEGKLDRLLVCYETLEPLEGE